MLYVSSHVGRLRRRFLLPLALAGSVAASLLSSVAGPATAQSAAPTGDFAAEAFGDPWDYSNPQDQVLAENVTYGLRNAQVTRGALRFDISGPSYVHPLWGGYPDSVGANRDGMLHPIDTGRFRRLVLRVTASQATPAGVHWYTCVDLARCEAGVSLNLEAGTHTYDVPLNWSGQVVSLRLLFAPSSATHIDIDWVRLADGDGPVDEWTGPTPVIDDPDITGGADYATLARNGDSWDFNESTDVARLENISGAVSGGVFKGTNTGPTINDPGLSVAVPRVFNGSDFHRATVQFTYDGAFSLANKVGGGTNARVIWRVAGGARQVSRDVVVYPGQDRFTIDLATNPASAAVDPRPSGPKTGWAGQQIDQVRFDPHEDLGARTFRIDSIKVAADDAGATGFTIALHDAQPAPGTTVSVWADTDRTGFDGTLIAENVDLSGSSASIVWTPPAGTTGTFWIHVAATRGATVARAYSSGPVSIGKLPPQLGVTALPVAKPVASAKPSASTTRRTLKTTVKTTVTTTVKRLDGSGGQPR